MPRQKPNLSKQDYVTDRRLIRATLKRLGIDGFAFDFAATKRNAQAPRYFTKKQNALLFNWREYLEPGEWGWLNPPFGIIGAFAELCALLGRERNIAFLVPASIGSDWFRDHVWGKALVLALNGRLAFIPSQPKALYPKDCMLCLFGPDIVPGFEIWDWRADAVEEDKAAAA